MGGLGNTFSAMDISRSALSAERLRMEVIVSNMANIDATRSEDGTVYQRRQVVFETVFGQEARRGEFQGKGVRVREVAVDPSPPLVLYLPHHPDADAQGMVRMPNIRPAEEMVDLMSASRSFEANATAFQIARAMYQRALELGR